LDWNCRRNYHRKNFLDGLFRKSDKKQKIN
jgi:hypothetical protein